MRRPRPTFSFEGTVVWWMPIASEDYWNSLLFEFSYALVQDGDHFVPFRNCECAAGTEIVLNINHY
jgi:hypothetical protein